MGSVGSITCLVSLVVIILAGSWMFVKNNNFNGCLSMLSTLVILQTTMLLWYLVTLQTAMLLWYVKDRRLVEFPGGVSSLNQDYCTLILVVVVL